MDWDASTSPENVEYDSAETYYRRMTALPLLDHLIQQMQEPFGEHQIFVSELLTLVPSLLCEQSATSLNFDRLVDTYRGDLPQPALVGMKLNEELMTFKVYFKVMI